MNIQVFIAYLNIVIVAYEYLKQAEKSLKKNAN